MKLIRSFGCGRFFHIYLYIPVWFVVLQLQLEKKIQHTYQSVNINSRVKQIESNRIRIQQPQITTRIDKINDRVQYPFIGFY